MPGDIRGREVEAACEERRLLAEVVTKAKEAEEKAKRIRRRNKKLKICATAVCSVGTAGYLLLMLMFS